MEKYAKYLVAVMEPFNCFFIYDTVGLISHRSQYNAQLNENCLRSCGIVKYDGSGRWLTGTKFQAFS